MCLSSPEEDVKEFTDFDDTSLSLMSKVRPLCLRNIPRCVLCWQEGKLSKGDIVGFLVKECGAEASKLGKIDVYDHYSLVAVLMKRLRVFYVQPERRSKVRKRLVSLL